MTPTTPRASWSRTKAPASLCAPQQEDKKPNDTRTRSACRRGLTTGLATLGVTALALSGASPALAWSSYSTLGNANIRSGPTTTAPIANVAVKGTRVSIDCYVLARA